MKQTHAIPQLLKSTWEGDKREHGASPTSYQESYLRSTNKTLGTRLEASHDGPLRNGTVTTNFLRNGTERN